MIQFYRSITKRISKRFILCIPERIIIGYLQIKCLCNIICMKMYRHFTSTVWQKLRLTSKEKNTFMLYQIKARIILLNQCVLHMMNWRHMIWN